MTIHPGIRMSPEFKVGDRVYIDDTCKDHPTWSGIMRGVVKGYWGERHAVEFEGLEVGHDCRPILPNGSYQKSFCSGRKGWWVSPQDLRRFSEFEDKVSAYVAKELSS